MPGEAYTPEEIDKMIAEGLDDIERGDTVDGEEAFRQLRALNAERRMQGA
jgi:hypothetical protein